MNAAELRKAIDSNFFRRTKKGGISARELASRLGISMRTTQRKIAKLLEDGKAKHAGERMEYGISGRLCAVPTYIIKLPRTKK